MLNLVWNRSRISLLGLACGLGLALAASPASAQKPPLKIGIMVPTSGMFAPNGLDALEAMKLYFDEVGNEVAGRKIELIVEDTQGRPDTGVTKARKLVEGDKVDILTGIVSTGVALAVNTYVREKKIPLVISADAGSNELTVPGPLLNPYLVRVTQNGRTPSAASADWGYKQGWRKVAVIAADYAGGIDTMGGFTQAFCKLGGQVVQELYPPLNTTDFAPFLTNLDRSVDAVAIFEPAADGLRFARQYSDMGLKGRIPLMDIYGQAAYEPNLAQLGDAALGVISSLHYSPVIKTPENEKFVKAFKERTKRAPADNGPDGYAGARAIVEAVKAVNGDLSNTEKFMSALRAVNFPSPKGNIRLDKYGQVIQNMYIRRVEKVGNDLANVPIQTYENVDQFWPMTYEEYASYKYHYAQLKGSMTNCAKVLEKK